MKNHVVLAFLMVLLVTSSCDFLRSLAGRPTSSDLDRKRVEIARLEELKLQQEKEQLRLDSLIAARQAAADSLSAMQARMITDSLALVDSLQQLNGTILNPTELGGLYTTKLDSRYYIIIGSFSRRANAENLLAQVAGEGYVPVLISFRNGLHAVGICQSDRLAETVEAFKSVRQKKFCPPDVWILLNE